MIGARFSGRLDERKIRKRADAGNFKSLGHAAAVIRLTAGRSIRRRKKPSAPGKPISTHTGAARRGYGYHVTKPHGPALIGPMASRLGDSMRGHEQGGRFRRRRFRARPVIGPAVASVGPRLAKFWSGSIR